MIRRATRATRCCRRRSSSSSRWGVDGLAEGNEAMIDLTGKTLANRYDLLALIGTGGMGAVYRARDRELDELVALKVIRHDLAALPQMAERFRHEVKLARRVTHVNVARTFELGSADGVMFCTMELIDGESLTSRLGQRRRLPITEAAPIAIAMCEALEAAHAAGEINRDIKPDNVLLAGDGRVVLADFGVAAVAAAEGELSGTPAYMAPEQARGEAPTPAADVYAVGAVLFEMLAGHRAFSGDVATILAAKQDLEHVALGPSEAPVELAQVLAHATARARDKRISSAAALGRALASWARPASIDRTCIWRARSTSSCSRSCAAGRAFACSPATAMSPRCSTRTRCSSRSTPPTSCACGSRRRSSSSRCRPVSISSARPSMWRLARSMPRL